MDRHLLPEWEAGVGWSWGISLGRWERILGAHLSLSLPRKACPLLQRRGHTTLHGGEEHKADKLGGGPSSLPGEDTEW